MIVETVVTDAALDALAPQWTDLLNRSPSPNPFLSHGWLRSWWDVYGHGELSVVTFRTPANRSLVGVLPLYRSQALGLRRLGIIRFLGSERTSSDFLECIALPAWRGPVYQECVTYLRAAACHGDTIELADLDRDSPFFHVISRANIPGLRTVQNQDKVCPYRVLPTSWGGLLRELSPLMRRRISRYRRALEKTGRVSLDLITESDDLADALDSMVHLRKDRLEQKKLSAPSTLDAYSRFHSLVLSRMLPSGMVRLYFLSVDGKRVAFLYLLAAGGRLFAYQTGFDRDWARLSVGFVLLGMAIESAIEQGLSIFEFLRGNESYKYEWQVSGSRQLADLVVPGASPAARLYDWCRIIRRAPGTVRRRLESQGRFGSVLGRNGIPFDVAPRSGSCARAGRKASGGGSTDENDLDRLRL